MSLPISSLSSSLSLQILHCFASSSSLSSCSLLLLTSLGSISSLLTVIKKELINAHQTRRSSAGTRWTYSDQIPLMQRGGLLWCAEPWKERCAFLSVCVGGVCSRLVPNHLELYRPVALYQTKFRRLAQIIYPIGQAISKPMKYPGFVKTDQSITFVD